MGRNYVMIMMMGASYVPSYERDRFEPSRGEWPGGERRNHTRWITSSAHVFGRLESSNLQQ